MDCAADEGQRGFGHVVYEIPATIDTTRLTVAWEETVRQIPALRSCTFTSKAGDAFQVVLRDSFTFAWMCWTSPDLKEAVVQDEVAAATAGPRCNRFVLLDNPRTKKRLLVWTFSHAFVDSSFQERIRRRVLTAYKAGHDELSRQPQTPPESPEAKTPDSVSRPEIPQAGNMERATQFWKEHLSGLNASVFPRLSCHLAVPYPDARAAHSISYSCSTQQKWSSTTVCRTALAILLSRYAHSPEALFGVVTEQAHMHEEQQLMMDGPTRTVVPIRVRCASDQPISGVMGAINDYNHTMPQFAHIGLCNIRGTGDDGFAACGFQTVLLVSDGDVEQTAPCEILQKTEESERFMPCTNRALLLSCHMASEGALLVARYNQSVIDSRQISRLLRQLGSLIQHLQRSTDDLPRVGDVDMVTPEDQAEILSWNSELIPAQDTQIHREILKWAAASPDKIAVLSWDGEWTYAELDRVSTRLAAYIKSSVSGKEQMILPLYFEKSKWVIATILAVLKAGHAFTLIDPNDPPARTSQVVQQTCSTVALTSKLHCSKVQAVVGRSIVIDDDLLHSLPETGDDDLFTSTAKPQDLAYAIFTSGSTGDPKGIMIEHRAFASCAIKFGPALGINHETRALQFGSHAFGACLLEIMTTLIHGGCVCVPSDDDRMNNVPAFINRSKVNWMMATPSYMGTFQPEDVPGLQTLVLVGEQMSPSVNDIWAPRVQLLNGYGQSESSSICCVANISPASSEPNNIGRAVGAHSWIIDPNDPNRLVPIGAIGELVVESPGIARDYIVPLQPDKSPFFVTAPTWYPSKQLPDGLKFYRTGDLASYASDGTIVCLGRLDAQVKIRGQRVELGAVETRLRTQMPDDVAIVVEAVKRSDPSSSVVLTAFLVGSSQVAEHVYTKSTEDAHILNRSAANEINAKLGQLLPRHSIPSCYICLGHLPRTATGKIDRRQLRAIGGRLLSEQTQGTASHPKRTPNSLATDTEAKLEEIWLQSLNLASDSENIGASFFELGGDSITAIKMVNKARSSGIELKVSDIYQNPTLAGLSAVINGSSTPYTLIPTSTREGPVEQSYSQGRLWFLDQLENGASWYLIPYAVRMRGPLDIDALTRALRALEQRHETLRTTFEDQNGEGVQIIHKKLAKELKIIDVADGEYGSYLQLLDQEQTTPFDLTSEAGWRASLIRLGKADHVLSIVMHHIVSDGWSIDIMRRELSQLYAAALQSQDPLSAMNPLPIQYSDFAVWQKQESQIIQHEKQLEYWRTQLRDCPPAKIPTDFPRPALLSGEAGRVPVSIDGDLYQKLRDFCNKHEVTSFAVLLAAFRATHYRLTGVDDAVIGTPIANRNRWELENIIGFFVNTQCMRITIEREDTFESLVRQVRSTTTAAFEHEDVPFERVVSALQPGSRDLSRNPLAQLIFAVHSQKDLGRFELQGLESEAVSCKTYTRFDVEFHLFQKAGELQGSVNFATDLFKLETIENVVSVFSQILRHGLDQPQTSISVLPLTDGIAELRNLGLLEIKQVEYPRDSSVVDIFRIQASACPDSLAVVDSSSRLTYAELDHRSDLLASWLRRRNMAAESLVGVLAPRSCQTIIAFLGILKANLAYLPLDVKSPAARMRDIISGLPGHTIVLLGSDVAAPELPLPDVELVPIADTLEYPEGNGVNGHAHEDSSSPSATSLAYVLFTSGSTGRPKGVMIEHRAIVRLAKSGIIPNFPSAARMAHMFNIAFDGATYEIFTTLLSGGTLVCIDYLTTLDAKALETRFAQEQVNIAMIAPALLKLYLADARDALKGLDVLLVGGDRFDAQDAIQAQALVRGQCYNAYGPTENGVMSTIYHVAANDPFINGVPLGRAINNSGAYVTDPNQQLVAAGVMGELVVTGDGLARGYTDRTLDKNRFAQLNVDGQTVRAYRTGDRVRYRVGEGLIEFFGRMDAQFKNRGNRIEAAEVESAILSHPSVRDAAVVLREDEGQEPEIVGFIAVDDDHSTEREETGNQVEGWQNHFEDGTYADISTISPSAIGNDFKGWTSMYDGSEIDKAEMQEWLDDTMQALHDGEVPSHVLEIGTGSGMILFNLSAGLQSYVGLEPSKSAAAFVNNAIKSVPALAGKAEVHVGTATDVSQLSGLRPDLVVFNSVVQYFPTPEYLTQVVDTLVRIPGVKRLFFGDIRSHAINRHFLAARAIHTLGNNATKRSVRQKMAELEEREEELLVEPAFFTALEKRLPDLIKHVEILPKNMQATNELSAYRYAAVVHLHDSDESARPVHSLENHQWIDFQAAQMDSHALLELLRLSKDTMTVAVSNIPCAKIAFERQIVESLDNDSKEETQSTLDGAAWISAVRSDAEHRVSMSVPELLRLAKESGFRVEVSAARQWSQSGALDAVFHHYPSSQTASRTLIRFPTDNQVRSSVDLANRPLQRLQRCRAALQVRERLQSLVPSYMIPSNIVVLDQMPLNASGKVDRKELARRARSLPKQQTAPPVPAFPISDIEVILCEEAKETFGMDVNITDHFFKLGGHSLLATKFVSRIDHRLKVRVTVKDMFDYPVFADLAVIIRQALSLQSPIPTAPDSGQSKPGWSARVAPRTETEAIICEEFAKALGIEVGITDNFFELGGHSLMATKLAVRLGHRLDATITIKDVFEHPVLFQLARKMELAPSKSHKAKDDIQTSDYAAFQLLSMEDPQAFIEREVATQLKVSCDQIQDVYPSTQMQKSFLIHPTTGQPRPLTQFYMDFPCDSDSTALTRACESLVGHLDMFRTVFLVAAGELYQVVLRHLDVAIETIETEENVNTATNAYLDRYLNESARLGQPLIRIAILKQSSSVRVLLRLSHALYDGLSLEPIVRHLHMLYNGRALPAPAQFAQYMQYVADSRKEGYEFWRGVLKDSPITFLGDAGSGTSQQASSPNKVLDMSRVIGVPLQALRSSVITQATVFNAACALMLSKESGANDVVFGRIVSGRQSLPVRVQDVVGPCTNAAPVRARIDADGDQQKLLRDMQDQYLMSLPFETLGFEELKRNCTDWPEAATNFGCCVTYHNFEYHPESQVEQQRVEMGILAKHGEGRKDEPMYDVAIAGEVEPDGINLKVSVVARSKLFDQERVEHLLDEVCKAFQTLNSSL
jgi:amino acid adenylation domain-containing protein